MEYLCRFQDRRGWHTIAYCIPEYDYYTFLRNKGTKYMISSNKNLTISWIDRIDKLPISKNPNWRPDISIICIYGND